MSKRLQQRLYFCPIWSCLLSIIFFLPSCQPPPTDYVYGDAKMKGVAWVAPPKPVGEDKLGEVKALGASWVALMPYGFVKKETGEFFYDFKPDGKPSQWWGEQPDGVRKCIEMAHNQQLKVLLKPHVWAGWGGYTGSLSFADEAAWQRFETGYRKYILTMAQIADSMQVEALCIGTEWQHFVAERPDFWKKLIKETKQIYGGKLTYAENWDAYQEVPFWNELDWIGVDAYFPLSETANPSVATLAASWQKHGKALKQLADSHQKPIVFTEIGYKSTDFAAAEPWRTDTNFRLNEPLQAAAYEAFFQEIWPKPWLAGAFIWKWFPYEKSHDAHDPFSPQGKAAQQVLQQNYRR